MTENSESEDSGSSFRESTDSSQSLGSRYTSRFHEHMSQAYSTYPPEWPFPINDEINTPTTTTKGHKHNPSIESFGSVFSNSSTTSVSDKFRKLAMKLKS